MREALETHETSISKRGRRVCNLLFIDDIDLIGGTNVEFQEFIDRLVN